MSVGEAAVGEGGLPPGWAAATLDELNDPKRPICYGILKPGPDVDGGVPYVKVRHIREERIDIGGLQRTTAEIDGQYQRSRLRGGDLLISIRGTYGRVAPVPAELSGANITQDSARLAPLGITPAYLQKFLQGPQAQRFFAAVARGVAVKGVNIGDLRLTPIAVPPLAEQERIVAAIEEAFSNLVAGEAGLRAVRQRLQRLRDAVLAAAVTGRLVPQDPTDTPAGKLLADLGVVEIEDHGLPQGWERVVLGSILARPLANGRSVRSRDGGFPVLRLTALRDGRIDLSERKDGEWTERDATPFLVQRGDFLVSRGNGSLNLVGRGGLIDVDPDPVAYPDTLIRVRPILELMDPAFLAMVWNSRAVRDQLESKARTTAGIYKVNQSMLEAVRLPLPPPEEQRRIVVEVERQLSFVEACERAVDAGLERSKALRRSVLKAAFEGRLVPQDPTDEPASVLLERIRAERAAAPKPGRRRRATD